MMRYDNYNQMADKIRHQPFLFALIHYCNKIFTALGYVMYPLLLIKLGLKGPLRPLLVCIIVPGLSFLAVSAFRKLCKTKRPYEIYPIRPLIHREKTGCSFPSRHTFCIFLIGGLWLLFNPVIGIVILACGLCLAMIRVIGGVHFIKDVLCGAILGLASAFLTSLII